MRKHLAALLVLMLPACAARQSIPIAATADIASTEVLLAQPGSGEKNPVMKDRAVRISVKALATVFLVWLCEEFEKDGHRGWAKAMQWAATGVWGGAAAWNLHLIEESRQ